MALGTGNEHERPLGRGRIAPTHLGSRECGAHASRGIGKGERSPNRPVPVGKIRLMRENANERKSKAEDRISQASSHLMMKTCMREILQLKVNIPVPKRSASRYLDLGFEENSGGGFSPSRNGYNHPFAAKKSLSSF